MLPGGSQIFSVGYKYNVLKVVYFFVTENEGNTQSSITYLSKYPDQSTNFGIFPFTCPLVVSKFFSDVNEVDSQKK